MTKFCRCLFGAKGRGSDGKVEHHTSIHGGARSCSRTGAVGGRLGERESHYSDESSLQNRHLHNENGSYKTGDSDYRAVEWMRNRSAESRGSGELSPEAALAWKNQARPIHRTKTAREESIEVDDLTLLGVNNRVGSQATTASTSSSFEYPKRNGKESGTAAAQSTSPSAVPEAARSSKSKPQPPPQEPSPPTRRGMAKEPKAPRTGTREGRPNQDELDAIVQALSKPADKFPAYAKDEPMHLDADDSGLMDHGSPSQSGLFRGGLADLSGATTALGDEDYERMLLAGATTDQYLADYDGASSFRTASPTKKSLAGSTHYVMQAVPRSSPRSSARSSPKSSPPRPRGSPNRAASSRTVEQLRALDPLVSSHDHPPFGEDSLSYVPSDVDQATRERYLRACRLLKSALIERETALLPQERVFLHGLLQQDLSQDHTYSDIEDRLSAIETASFTLLSDPLFQVDSVHSSTFEQIEESHRRPRRSSGSHLSDEKKDSTDAVSLGRSRSGPRLAPIILMEEDRRDESHQPSTTVASVARFDGKDVPFYILGVTPNFKVGALTPSLMEALRGFFPAALADENFFLKYSLHRDGTSLPALLSRVRTSQYTVLAVETMDGHVFGAFCSAPWRVQSTWFGYADSSFLWRLKRSRFHPGSTCRDFSRDSEMEVYPCTGKNAMIQYCTTQTLAVGGGEWSNCDGNNRCPYPDEQSGIGLMIDGDLMGGETNSCSTFANPRLGQRLSKGNEFDIRCLEVWTVTPAVTIEEAENLEMRRHFVDSSHNIHGLTSLDARAL